MQTLDSPGKSAEMDSTANPGGLNKESVFSVSSFEYLRIHTFDRRVVTRISIGTQTDWRHEDECSQDYKCPNQETSQAPHKNLRWTSEQSVPKNMKSEISPDNEVLDSLSKETPQTPAACQGETEESLTKLDKIPTSSVSDSSELSLQTVLNICCKHSRYLKKPPVSADHIAKSVTQEDPRHPTELLCCEEAPKLSEILLKGRAVITEETVNDMDPAIQKDQRLKGLEFERSSDRQTPKAGHKQQLPATLHNGFSADAWTAKKQGSFPEMEIMDSENTFSLNAKHGGQKRATPLVKHYNNGQTFVVIFPDGTGQVCYPSGTLAILVSAAQSADWSCVVILEDKHPDPHVQAVFTSRGQGACYHNNGCVWVNLTPWGGTCCSDTGDVKKHWSWLDNKHYVHAPPCQPLHLKLSPNVNIRIQSQEHIYISFTSGECSVRLNVGARLKPNQGKGLMLPGDDMLQRHLQQKSAEINVLLQNIQSLITYQKTVRPRKVKPWQSLISQMERRQLPMKQQQSAKKTP